MIEREVSKTKGYKAFEPGMICRGKQYKENTVFEETEAVICEKGMHFCENPMDVLRYYPLVNDDGEFSDFAEVESLDEPITDDGIKFVSKKLRVGAKLNFKKFIDASVEFLLEKTVFEDKTMSVDFAQIGSSGDFAQIGSSGERSVICCAGHGCSVKAKKGSWITLSEWGGVKGVYSPLCVKTEYVDGERIKEDVFYELKNGEFVEVWPQ